MSSYWKNYGKSARNKKMIDRVINIIPKLLTGILLITVGFWSIRTIIVIYFLIDRWINLGWESISNYDLHDYIGITKGIAIVGGFVFLSRLLLIKSLAHNIISQNKILQTLYSNISILLSGLCIAIIIKINFEIAQEYLQSSGKQKALFGLTLLFRYSYQYCFVGLSLLALLLTIIGTKKNENKMLNIFAYFLGIFSLVIIFARIWTWMI